MFSIGVVAHSFERYLLDYFSFGPIIVAVRSKTWTVFLARTLGSWVRIPLKAWMSIVRVYSMFVLFCMKVAALRRADPSFQESCRLCIGSRNQKKKRGGQGQTKGCIAIIIIIICRFQFISAVFTSRRGSYACYFCIHKDVNVVLLLVLWRMHHWL
jgi:hypothetical protein